MELTSQARNTFLDMGDFGFFNVINYSFNYFFFFKDWTLIDLFFYLIFSKCDLSQSSFDLDFSPKFSNKVFFDFLTSQNNSKIYWNRQNNDQKTPKTSKNHAIYVVQ